MTFVLRVPGTADNAALENYKDPVIPPAGMKFLFDLASPLSWAVQGDPVTGNAVKDVAGGSDGAVAITSGQTVDWAGNGFDFTGNTADGQIVTAPAGALGSIWSATNDYFMVCFYAKLPIAEDWNTDSTLATMFCCTTHANGYLNEVDLLNISQQNGPNMRFRRQTDGGTTVVTTDVSPALHYGREAQVGFWRNASGIGARLKSSGGTTLATAAVGSNNSGDFSAKVPRWGICESFNDLGLKAAHVEAAKWRLYRGFLEDLSASGRDPVTVLDADYARTIARGVFS